MRKGREAGAAGTLVYVRNRGAWAVAALLALPFAVAVAALQGLTRTMPTFHGGDERDYHLPAIEQFARQLPAPDLVDYPAAQTPLYHLLVAGWGRVAGMEMWRLRLLGVLAAYLAALALYALLRRTTGIERWPAAGLALVFALSPYVFGQAFVLGTDDLGLLLALLAIERFAAFDRGFARTRSLAPFAVACAWLALALLTRQSYVWLGCFGGLWLLRTPRLGLRAAAAGAGMLLVAALPFAALVVAWKGIVPVGGDPASCGICAPERGRLGWREVSPLRAPLLTLAIAGFYGTLLFARPLWEGMRGLAGIGGRGARRSALPAAVGGAAGAALLLAVPMVQGEGDEGWIWRLARSGPAPLGSAWIFWLLVPLGCALVVLGMRRLGWRALPVVLGAAFLAAQVATRLPYQKYFDPFVLLVCLLALRPADLRSWRDAIGPGVVVAASLAYVAAFVAGVILVVS